MHDYYYVPNYMLIIVYLTNLIYFIITKYLDSNCLIQPNKSPSKTMHTCNTPYISLQEHPTMHHAPLYLTIYLYTSPYIHV